MGTDLVMHEGVDLQVLISQGLEKGAGIDVMERLFVMAKDAAAIRAKRAFFESLAEFQSEMGTITKTKEVKFTNKSGKVTNYSYAPLEDIIEAVKIKLKDNGFSYTLKTVQDATSVAVTCEAHHEAGHTEISSVTVQIDVDAYMSGPQKVGAAITYAKRYAFCNAYGIMTGDEDTDAVDAEAKPEPNPTKKDAPPFPKEDKKPLEINPVWQAAYTKVHDVLEHLTIGQTDKEKQKSYNTYWEEAFTSKPKVLKYVAIEDLEKFYAHLIKQVTK